MWNTSVPSAHSCVPRDIHFSSATALAVAPHVEKVRINPGNFHRDHDEARRQFLELLDVCKQHGTAIRIGLNHGSLGEYITNLYGNTPLAMAKAAMEWVDMCIERKFYQVVVSLKASNTLVVVEAYRLLAQFMQERGVVFPLHVGVTEAGNGDSGRIKSCVGISTLLAEGLGNTIRVSLTEDPVNELPVARYLADRYDHRLYSSLTNLKLEGKKAVATYEAPSRERLLLDAACDFGKRLLDKELDEVSFAGTYRDETGTRGLPRLRTDHVRPPGGLRSSESADQPSEERGDCRHGVHCQRPRRDGRRRLGLCG